MILLDCSTYTGKTFFYDKSKKRVIYCRTTTYDVRFEYYFCHILSFTRVDSLKEAYALFHPMQEFKIFLEFSNISSWMYSVQVNLLINSVLLGATLGTHYLHVPKSIASYTRTKFLFFL